MTYDELIQYFQTATAAANGLGVSPSTVSAWRKLGVLPAYAANIVHYCRERDAALAELAATRSAMRELAKLVH